MNNLNIRAKNNAIKKEEEQNMPNHILQLEIARQRHQERLQQAEAARLCRKLTGNQPGVLNRPGRFAGWGLAVAGLLSAKSGIYWFNTKI